MSKRERDEEVICEGCIDGKSFVHTFPKSGYGQVKSKSVFQLIHSGVMGLMETKSQGGARFMLTFIHDYSRYVVSYFIRHKSEGDRSVPRFQSNDGKPTKFENLVYSNRQ